METANASSNNIWWYYIVMMAVLFGAMYFISIRPQKKKENEMKNLRNSLQIGDEIMTIGGFFGTVVRIKEDRVTIASGSEKTKLEISKSAINTVLNREINVSKKEEQVVEEKAEKVSPKKVKKLSKKEEAVDDIPKED